MEEYYVTVGIRRFLDRQHAIVNRVAHLVGRRDFDEIPNSTAHGGTVVNNNESGPARAGHRGERLLRFFAEKQYGNSYFFASKWQTIKLRA